MLIRDLSTSPWPILHNRITATLLDACLCATCATALARSLDALRGKPMPCSGWGCRRAFAIDCRLRDSTRHENGAGWARGKGSLAGSSSQGSSRPLNWCLMLVLGA